MNTDIIHALRLHHEAKRAEAIANLNILIDHPVGIGDHPQVEEALKWLDQLDDATSQVQTVMKIILRRDSRDRPPLQTEDCKDCGEE